MNTIELVDPAGRELAQAFAAFDPTKQPLKDYRAALDAAMGAAAAPSWQEAWAPGVDGQPDVRVLMYRPKAATGALPAILFIHASGFIAGRPEWMAAANQALADAHQALVVAVTYRLAPETRFPGPLEDCYTALRWLRSNLGWPAEGRNARPSRRAGGATGAMSCRSSPISRACGHHLYKQRNRGAERKIATCRPEPEGTCQMTMPP